MPYDELNTKLLILGDGNIGKTSLANYYTNHPLPEHYMPTIGSNVYNKVFKIEQNNVLIKVNVWDIGGQRSFNPMNPIFYKNADIALLVFDLSRPEETLKSVFDYHLKNQKKYAPESLYYIIGNKFDLVEQPKKIKEKIEALYQDHKVLGFCSAKDGYRVEDIFNWTIYQFLRSFEKTLGKNEQQYKVSHLFLELIGKKESEFSKLFSKPYDFDEEKHKSEISSRVKKGINFEKAKKGITIKKYNSLKAQIEDYENIKDNIIKNFNSNLSKIEKVITNLSKTPINKLMSSLKQTQSELNDIKQAFSANLDSLLKLNNNSEIKS
mgnify:CR=1 FL=1